MKRFDAWLGVQGPVAVTVKEELGAISRTGDGAGRSAGRASAHQITGTTGLAAGG